MEEDRKSLQEAPGRKWRLLSLDKSYVCIDMMVMMMMMNGAATISAIVCRRLYL